jgi:hypothetical protein
MSHGHRPPIREFNPQWEVNIPELKTRTVLLEAIKTHKIVRRKLFQTAQALESIALIPDRNVAEYCLALYWRERKRDLRERLEDKLREQTGNDALFNELFGCLRNVYFNMRRKANELTRVRPRKNDRDMVREYRLS